MTQDKVKIFDDVLSNDDIDKILNKNFNYKLEGVHQYNDITFLHSLIEIASNHYSLKKCVGYEVWNHINTQPIYPFIDKDDNNKEKEKYPIFSMIYYVSSENVEGKKLLLDNDIVIEPKQNRLVIFDPGIKQMFEPQTNGVLITIHINPWEYKI